MMNSMNYEYEKSSCKRSAKTLLAMEFDFLVVLNFMTAHDYRTTYLIIIRGHLSHTEISVWYIVQELKDRGGRLFAQKQTKLSQRKN